MSKDPDKTNKISTSPVTIREVAAAAGVSTSTVSRVLNGRQNASSSKSAQRVREVAERLGYSPDVFAAGLRRSGSKTVGVLVPRLTDYVMAALFEEVAAACAQRGYFTVVATTADDSQAARKAAKTLLQRRVDGLVLTTVRDDDNFAEELRQQNVPHVLVLRTDGISPSAVGDDHLGGYLAARHLLDLGHRDIGFVAGPIYASSARGRVEGFQAALEEAGIEPDASRIRPSAFSMESGEQVGKALLTQEPRPTAIFAVNDHTAVGVLAAAHGLGLRVPEDLSVIGYNDTPLASRLPVPLTSVRTPFRQIASDAVELLLNESTGEIRITPPTLIPRASTSRCSKRIPA